MLQLLQRVNPLIHRAETSATSSGWLLDNNMAPKGSHKWLQFRDGRNPPRCSSFGAILLFLGSKEGTERNFPIPDPKSWHSLVQHYLSINDYQLDFLFEKYFDIKRQRNLWTDFYESR